MQSSDLAQIIVNRFIQETYGMPITTVLNRLGFIIIEELERAGFGAESAEGEPPESPEAVTRPDEAEYLAIINEAFEQNPPIAFQIEANLMFVLVSLLQFAERGLPPGHKFRKVCVSLGRQMQAAIVEATGSRRIYEVMETGWNPAFDVVQPRPPEASAEFPQIEKRPAPGSSRGSPPLGGD